MFDVIQQAGLFVMGLAGLYLLWCGVLPDKQRDLQDEGRETRVWMAYGALCVFSLGALIWIAGRLLTPSHNL
jgi:hypothetical protein